MFYSIYFYLETSVHRQILVESRKFIMRKKLTRDFNHGIQMLLTIDIKREALLLTPANILLPLTLHTIEISELT